MLFFRWFLVSLIVLIIGMLMLKPLLFFLYLHLILPDQMPNLKVNGLLEMDRNAIVLLDTRAYEEYQVSHIKDARWVGFDDFDLEKVESLPKDTTIVLYCSVGYRSDLIGQKLADAGYQHVYNLWGGIFAWVNRGQPVYLNGAPTDQVHPYSPGWGFWLSKGEKAYGSISQKKAPH